MNHKYVIALTFNEFQVLYSSSEIRIARYRPVAIPADSTGRPNFKARSGREVLEKAPHFDVEAEHSIMVGVIDQLPEGQKSSAVTQIVQPISPDVFYLPIRCFESFHALTERGARILAGRLEGFEIDLQPPLFELDVLGTIAEWSLRRSLAGAAALVELITGDGIFDVETSFTDQAIVALEKAQNGTQLPVRDGVFLSSLLCYERHEAIPRTDIGYLMDLGLIIRDCLPESSTPGRLDAFRNLVKALGGSSENLSSLINLPDLKKVLNEFEKTCGVSMPLPLSALFVKWKHAALNSGDLDLNMISSDVVGANKSFNPEELKRVLWLFGLYWGIDRLVPGYYYRMSNQYRFLQHEKKIEHKPVTLKSIEIKKKALPKARVPKKSVAVIPAEPNAIESEREEKEAPTIMVESKDAVPKETIMDKKTSSENGHEKEEIDDTAESLKPVKTTLPKTSNSTKKSTSVELPTFFDKDSSETSKET